MYDFSLRMSCMTLIYIYISLLWFNITFENHIKTCDNILSLFFNSVSCSFDGSTLQGSTCTFCEAILRESGFRTGLFTSPHLIDVRERFRINGLVFDWAHLSLSINIMLCITWADTHSLPLPTLLHLHWNKSVHGYKFYNNNRSSSTWNRSPNSRVPENLMLL